MPQAAIFSTHVEYVIPAVTRTQARAVLLAAIKPLQPSIATLIWLTLTGTLIASDPARTRVGLEFLAACVAAPALLMLATVLRAVVLLRLLPDGHCAIDITADGLSGTYGRRTISLPWAKIASVSDTGGSLVFATRGLLHGSVWIPKASLANPHALWSQIDDVLVSKRGLLPGRCISTFILNTAF